MKKTESETAMSLIQQNEKLKKENEELKKKNLELERKYKDDLNRIYSAKALTAEDCNIGYLINVILRKMDENHQPFLVTVIDDMLVDIHSKEFEPKKPVSNYASYYGVRGKGVTL